MMNASHVRYAVLVGILAVMPWLVPLAQAADEPRDAQQARGAQEQPVFDPQRDNEPISGSSLSGRQESMDVVTLDELRIQDERSSLSF
jgi:hypothetical protein